MAAANCHVDYVMGQVDAAEMKFVFSAKVRPLVAFKWEPHSRHPLQLRQVKYGY